MIDYIEGLMNDQSDITNDANDLYQSLDERDETDLENSIQICSTFIIDSLSHVMMTHYDPLWLFMNDDKANILSKQKEREKQNIIQKLEGVSREERFLIGERNKIGASNFWKEANAEAAEVVKSREYGRLNEQDRIEKIKEIYEQAGINMEYLGEDEPVLPPQLQQYEEEGYRNESDIEDEEDEDYMGGMDGEQEMEFNE